MRAFFLVRITSGGQPDFPPMQAQGAEDALAYESNGKARGGYVIVSPLGLQGGQPINWTNNVAIALVRAPDAVIDRAKIAVNTRWFWLYGGDKPDDDDTPDDETIDPDSGARAAAFKVWLKAAATASALSAARKTAWRTAIDAEVITTERKIALLACRLCGVTAAQIKQGMIG